jgi:peroxiredoxin
MQTRWIVAAVAAVVAAVLTVPMLIGRSEPVEIDPDATAGASPTCKALGPAKLDFTVKDMHGADVQFADFKGKVVLINYWATWCSPCKTELPAFVDLYARYKDQGLVILGVSVDDDPETLRAFAQEWKLNYPIIVGRDRTDVVDAYGPLIGYPTSFILGRDGVVCGRHIGPATKEQFEKEIKALL